MGAGRELAVEESICSGADREAAHRGQISEASGIDGEGAGVGGRGNVVGEVRRQEDLRHVGGKV